MLIDLNIIKKVKKKSSFFRKFIMYRKKGKAVFFSFFLNGHSTKRRKIKMGLYQELTLMTGKDCNITSWEKCIKYKITYFIAA